MSLVTIPDTRRNRKRVVRAIALAARDEGRNVRLGPSLYARDGVLSVFVPFERVHRSVRRRLIYDWQRGLLEGVPPMRAPVRVYAGYGVCDGEVYRYAGYLWPDGFFSRAETVSGRWDAPASEPDEYRAEVRRRGFPEDDESSVELADLLV